MIETDTYEITVCFAGGAIGGLTGVGVGVGGVGTSIGGGVAIGDSRQDRTANIVIITMATTMIPTERNAHSRLVKSYSPMPNLSWRYFDAGSVHVMTCIGNMLIQYKLLNGSS